MKQLFFKGLDIFSEKYWLHLVYLMGIVLFFSFLLNRSSWTEAQQLMCLFAIAIPLHIFEENTWPGGFFFMNNLTFGSKAPTIYPQNRLTNMITNLGAECVFILLTLNAAHMETTATVVVIFFGIVETFNHSREGIAMYRRYKKKGKHTIYAPGLFTSFFPLLPLAIFGLRWILEASRSFAEIAAGVGIAVGIAVCLILIPFAISTKIKSQRFAFKDIGYFKKYEETL